MDERDKMMDDRDSFDETAGGGGCVLVLADLLLLGGVGVIVARLEATPRERP